jgi:acetyl/propionyl-CoA carboxylase alpha subunit
MPFPSFTQPSAAGEINVNHTFELDGAHHQLWLSRGPQGYHLRLQDRMIAPVTFSHHADGHGLLTIAGRSVPVRFAIDGDAIHLRIRGRSCTLRYLDPLRTLAHAGTSTGHLVARAPMPGVVVTIKAAAGEVVVAGAPLMVIESMKLETVIRSPLDGVVEHIHLKEGDSFDRDAVLATLTPKEP